MRSLPLVALALLLLAGPLVQGALAVRDNNGGAKYHWGRDDMPFTLELGDNVKGKWDRYLKRSVKEWGRSDVVAPKVVRGSTKASKCDENRGRVEVCNFNYGETKWLGLTRIYYDRDDHITAATVKINDYYFLFNSKYNDRSAKRHTMCHEIGHSFGLGHVNNSSCMNDSEEAIFNNVKPKRSDFRALKKTYKHRDKRNEITVGGRGGRIATAGKSGPTSEGGGFFEIEQPATTETRTVEMLPDGRTVETFTTWVE